MTKLFAAVIDQDIEEMITEQVRNRGFVCDNSIGNKMRGHG